MDLSMVLFGGFFLLLVLSHGCAYKFGKYQGGLDALRTDAQYGKEGMQLQEGETFLGVVDVKHGPHFFIANAGKDLPYE